MQHREERARSRSGLDRTRRWRTFHERLRRQPELRNRRFTARAAHRQRVRRQHPRDGTVVGPVVGVDLHEVVAIAQNGAAVRLEVHELRELALHASLHAGVLEDLP